MAEQNDKKDKNIGRRNFLKKMASTAVFVIPTIQTFSLLQAQSNWWWWTGHHHHHVNPHHGSTPPAPPPPPPGFGG